jgi:hypothetical protein
MQRAADHKAGEARVAIQLTTSDGPIYMALVPKSSAVGRDFSRVDVDLETTLW